MANQETQDLLRQAFRHLQEGRPDDAVALAARILEIDPKHADAMALPGHVAFADGRLGEAEEAYRSALRANPREATYHYYLGETLSRRGRASDALACYERALKLKPQHIGSVAGKARALIDRGKADRARAFLEPFVRGGPAIDPRCALMQARVEGRLGDDEAVERIVQGQLQRDGLPEPIRRGLLYELAASRDRRDMLDEAMETLAEVNALLQPNFDVEATTARFEAIRAAFAPEVFDALPRSGTDDEQAVFVVGMPGSGADLVAQVIDEHPKGAAAGERRAMLDLIADLPGTIGAGEDYPDCVAAATTGQLDAIATDFIADLRRGHAGASRIVDAQLAGFEHIGFMSRLLPKAHFVYARRAPLELCFSCLMRNLGGAAPYTGQLKWLGAYHRAFEAFMVSWQEHPGVRLHTVDYEQLIASPEPTVRGLLEFVGLRFSDRCLRAVEASDDVVDRAERYGERLDPLRKALAGKKR
jgi:Tfp pilus assembly protein PilF